MALYMPKRNGKFQRETEIFKKNEGVQLLHPHRCSSVKPHIIIIFIINDLVNAIYRLKFSDIWSFQIRFRHSIL